MMHVINVCDIQLNDSQILETFPALKHNLSQVIAIALFQKHVTFFLQRTKSSVGSHWKDKI